MQLTHFTDIGLRVLMYLSQHQRESLITMGELAAQLRVPHNHLIKVVNRLVKLGWVEATRGRNGGLRLVASTLTLHLGMIVQALEGDKQLIDCEKAVCALVNRCELQNVLASALQHFYQHLNQYTLADMVQGPAAVIITQMHRNWMGNNP